MYVYMYIYIYTCIYIYRMCYIYIYVYTYIHIHTYIYIHNVYKFVYIYCIYIYCVYLVGTVDTYCLVYVCTCRLSMLVLAKKRCELCLGRLFMTFTHHESSHIITVLKLETLRKSSPWLAGKNPPFGSMIFPANETSTLTMFFSWSNGRLGDKGRKFFY